MILYKFPSRRPSKMFSVIENIFELSVTDDWKIQLTLDVDDAEMTKPEVLARIKSYGDKVIYYYGISTGKINACNRDLELSPPFDIIVLQSDDMVWLERGFDSWIVEDMKDNFPDFDGVLHYPDASPADDKLITLSILGKKYFERFGYLYNPIYASVFCDNEFTEISKKLGKYKFLRRLLYDHRHPIWRKCEMDDLYRRNEDKALYQMDREIYFQRLAENFGI